MALNLNAANISAPAVCPPPLLEQSLYANSCGYIRGRYCGAGTNENGTVCCLPCPIQDWVYPSEWKAQLKIPNYLSILSLLLCIFLLLSFALLPPEKTHRHYLSVGLLFPVFFISLAFVIPAGYDPPLCSDDITPNDMHSSLSCAWTGTFIAIGGLGSVIWVFLRSLWLHIRIFWDRDPGRKFKYGSIAAGTILPAAFLTALLVATGVSYRMGSTCLPNHPNAIASFWIWLVGFAIAGFILQAITTGYCIWAFVRAMKREWERVSHSSSGRNSASQKLQTWRHVKNLFLLQWRNILISVFVIIGSISFFIVFWSQDAKLGAVVNNPDDLMLVRTWITCLILSKGNKEMCLQYVHGFTVSEKTVLVSLILASLVGIEIFILLARLSMFSAWRDFFARPFPSLKRRPTSPLLSSLENPSHFKPLPLASTYSTSSPSSAARAINRTDSTKFQHRFHLGVLRPAHSLRHGRPSQETANRAHGAPELLPLPSAPPTTCLPHIPTNPPTPPPAPGTAVSTSKRLHTPLERSASSSPLSPPPRISAPIPASFAHIATAFPPPRTHAPSPPSSPLPTLPLPAPSRPPSPLLGRSKSIKNVQNLPAWAREREEERQRRRESGESDESGAGAFDLELVERGGVVGRGGLGMNPLR